MYVPIMSSPLPFGEVIKVFTWNKSDKPLPASGYYDASALIGSSKDMLPPSPESSRCIILGAVLSTSGVSFGNEVGPGLYLGGGEVCQAFHKRSSLWAPQRAEVQKEKGE